MRRQTNRGRGLQTSAGPLTEAWRKGSREDAKTRKVWDRVPQLPMTFCSNEGVLECSGLTELWIGIERVDGKSKAVSSHRSPRKKDPESHAKARRKGRRRGSSLTRRVGDRVPQLPKRFCGHEGVLECSGWTELGMGIERVDGKIQSSVKPPQSKKEGCGISREDANVWG
jgi:hypothetical protein